MLGMSLSKPGPLKLPTTGPHPRARPGISLGGGISAAKGPPRLHMCTPWRADQVPSQPPMTRDPDGPSDPQQESRPSGQPAPPPSAGSAPFVLLGIQVESTLPFSPFAISWSHIFSAIGNWCLLQFSLTLISSHRKLIPGCVLCNAVRCTWVSSRSQG